MSASSFASPLLGQPAAYETVFNRFAWPDMTRFNIAQACCDVHADVTPDRPAILEVATDFTVSVLTFGEMRRAADRLAHAFLKAGIRKGDRVAILLPQGRYVPITHMAIYKIGAIALPLAALFGADALAYRLSDSGARLVVTDATGAAKLKPLRGGAPGLEQVVSIDGDGDGAVALARFIEGMVTNGSSRDFAERCFEQIKGFGSYGFPESHAVSFARLDRKSVV